jgi:hypothetical protein
MAMGIRRPGFQLLSLVPPTNASVGSAPHTHADTLCLLPDQIAVYVQLYLPLGVLTMLLLLFSATCRPPGKAFRLTHSSSPSSGLPSPSLAGAKLPRKRRWPLRPMRSEARAGRERDRLPRRRQTIFREFVKDVRDVGWTPMMVFGLVTCWAFW